MKKEITEFTRDQKAGYLLHTIGVECSYWEYKHANEYDAVCFFARTDGKWNGEEVSDFDYSIQCSMEEARDFARYIFTLCDEIEMAKIKASEKGAK